MTDLEQMIAALAQERERVTLLQCALTLAQMSLEQGQDLNGRIAANGPTIGEVIARALR